MELNAQVGKPRPRVGVGIMIKNDHDEVLLGLRKSAHGTGEWSFPGGHLEFGETIFEAAKREVKEETDLDIDQFELVSIADEMRYMKSDNKHYVNIGVLARYQHGEPKTMEPDKCVEWKWVALDQLPANLFEATGLLVRNYRDGKIYQPS